MKLKFLFVLFSCCLFSLNGQKECSKWYFGNYVALDFSSLPPSQLGNSSMRAIEGCASIGDAAGNLLFYSNGVNIWNSAHSFMANGTGLLGDTSASQGTLILKQPGSQDKYYIFTSDDYMGNNGLRYSIVDMSLAAGMGSVTIKNVLLLNQKPSEQICAIKHCNTTDMWIVGIDRPNNRFVSFLFSNAGVSSSPVTTPVTLPPANYIIGQLKSSPNGTKVLSALSYSNNWTSVNLYDFDPQTGFFSNELILHDTSAYSNAAYRYYGCEFSPDGSKIYAVSFSGKMYQWDLCSVGNTMLKQSKLLISGANSQNARSMQLSPDGKIYVTADQQQSLGIINQPNLAGQACNYVSTALSITSGSLTGGLPNFPSHDFFQKKPLPFTNTVNCRTVNFYPSTLGCGSPGVQAYVWNFGENQLPAQNTSTLPNPAHTYSVPGIYTVTLVRQFACYSDTISQVLNVAAATTPTLQLNAPTAICLNETHSLTVSGANVYNWSSGETTAQAILTASMTGNYTYTVTGSTAMGCSATKTLSVSVSNCTDIDQYVLQGIKIYSQPGSGYTAH